jgi:hypothetical protein
MLMKMKMKIKKKRRRTKMTRVQGETEQTSEEKSEGEKRTKRKSINEPRREMNSQQVLQSGEAQIERGETLLPLLNYPAATIAWPPSCP